MPKEYYGVFFPKNTKRIKALSYIMTFVDQIIYSFRLKHEVC